MSFSVNKSLYNTTEIINTHWINWPEGGNSLKAQHVTYIT